MMLIACFMLGMIRFAAAGVVVLSMLIFAFGTYATGDIILGIILTIVYQTGYVVWNTLFIRHFVM